MLLAVLWLKLVIGMNDVRIETTESIRSCWIPVQYFGSLTDNSFAELGSLNISRVYLDVWNNGKIYFNSTTMNNILPDGSGYSFDALSKYIPMASKYNIKVIAWFEYGLMTSYGGVNNAFAVYAQKNNWLLGEFNNFYWLNPSNNDVISFLVGILSDAINNYPHLYGIQLDDHYACPSGFSICNRNLMNSITNDITTQLDNMNSGKILSLSPSTYSYSYNTLNIDYIHFMKEQYFTDYVPQLYYSSYSTFETNLQDLINTMYNDLGSSFAQFIYNNELEIGIRVDGSGGTTTWTNVNNMIYYTQNTKHLGAVIWYCDGILNLYYSQFKNIWG